MKTELYNNYSELRAKYPDYVLLFRRGLSYFAFEDHAKLLAEINNVEVMTDGEITTASIAEFKLKSTLQIMTNKGHRVAICEDY